MIIELPAAIAAFFTADRAGDADRIAQGFTEDAQVLDERKRHTGREAIRRWMADASTRFDYTSEPVAIAEEGGRTIVTSHLVGNFPGSPVDLRYIFELRDDRIASLEIRP
jgi:ketosteroid isomerase-like protein